MKLLYPVLLLTIIGCSKSKVHKFEEIKEIDSSVVTPVQSDDHSSIEPNEPAKPIEPVDTPKPSVFEKDVLENYSVGDSRIINHISKIGSCHYIVTDHQTILKLDDELREMFILRVRKVKKLSLVFPTLTKKSICDFTISYGKSSIDFVKTKYETVKKLERLIEETKLTSKVGDNTFTISGGSIIDGYTSVLNSSVIVTNWDELIRQIRVRRPLELPPRLPYNPVCPWPRPGTPDWPYGPDVDPGRPMDFSVVNMNEINHRNLVRSIDFRDTNLGNIDFGGIDFSDYKLPGTIGSSLPGDLGSNGGIRIGARDIRGTNIGNIAGFRNKSEELVFNILDSTSYKYSLKGNFFNGLELVSYAGKRVYTVKKSKNIDLSKYNLSTAKFKPSSAGSSHSIDEMGIKYDSNGASLLKLVK